MELGKLRLGDFIIHRKERFKPNDPRIAGLKRIDKIDFSGRIFLSDKLSNTDMILIKKGDLVISGINVEKGAMNIYTGDDDVVATIHYSSYQFDGDKIDFEFLQYFLKSSAFKKALKEQVPGGIKTEIKPKHLLPLLVNIPVDVLEQRKIVSYLNLLNDKIKFITEELVSQLDLVKQLRESFLTEAIQGKLVRSKIASSQETGQQLYCRIKEENAKLVKGKKLKDKKATEVNIKEFPFEVPENWTWCRLKDICSKIGSGSTPKGSNYARVGKPFFRSQNVHDSGLVYDDIKFISDIVQEKMIGTKVIAGDILLNITGGSLGRAALVPEDFEEGNVSQHVCIIRPIIFNSRFLHRLILSPFFQNMIFSSTTGTGRVGLPKYNLENFLVPVPPLSVQEEIVSKLDNVINLCDEIELSVNQSKFECQRITEVLLNEGLGDSSTYDVKVSALKRKIKKFYIDENTFENIDMNILEILKTSESPISATIVWNSCEFSKDIEGFYAELKRLIDIEKVVLEEKRGKESFLKLANNED